MQLINCKFVSSILWQKQCKLTIYKALDALDKIVAYVFVWSYGSKVYKYNCNRDYNYAEIPIHNYDAALLAKDENELLSLAHCRWRFDQRKQIDLSHVKSKLIEKFESNFSALTLLQNLPIPKNANGKVTTYEEIKDAKSILVKESEWPKMGDECSKQEVANPNFGNKQNIGIVVTYPGKNSLFVDGQGNQFLIIRSRPFDLNGTKYEVITLVPRTNKFNIENAKIT